MFSFVFHRIKIDFSSEIKPITPERTGPEQEYNRRLGSEALM